MRYTFAAFMAAFVVLGGSSRADAHASDRTIVHTYATSYCLEGTMRDGSYTRARSIASDLLPLGAKIRLVGRSFYGMRRFVVRDTGSALFDGHIDLWSPSCATSIAWGRRPISFHMGWSR